MCLRFWALVATVVGGGANTAPNHVRNGTKTAKDRTRILKTPLSAWRSRTNRKASPPDVANLAQVPHRDQILVHINHWILNLEQNIGNCKYIVEICNDKNNVFSFRKTSQDLKAVFHTRAKNKARRRVCLGVGGGTLLAQTWGSNFYGLGSLCNCAGGGAGGLFGSVAVRDDKLILWGLEAAYLS